ncbi:hypothetical protein [Sphingomonas sp. PAMC 26605]|uniref:hypothetical protein n=1 Tax=Sphingomonas sp. PAMC 26605 TaxID=1112214 RepID=UPI0012F47C2A|nr:hypothetical protein [Sphingomonas sp. PAMC 26605]
MLGRLSCRRRYQTGRLGWNGFETALLPIKSKGSPTRSPKSIFLKELGPEKLDLGLVTGMLKAQARSMLCRKPATLRRIRGERKTLEGACFLHSPAVETYTHVLDQWGDSA